MASRRFRPDTEEDRYRRQAMTWPIIGNEIRVVDTGMNDVPRDLKTIGEIVVRGDHVMEGYWGDVFWARVGCSGRNEG